ncbi:hypothetical protein ACFV42_23635 [Streptomyces solisilvae]|uniref:hypothetical protein n=1 Tax=Streptomyces malaysiensis TaxID=92644 RepID=UPI00369FEE42
MPLSPGSEGVDPRARLLAEHRQRIAHEGIGYLPAWGELTPQEREESVREAAHWLRAAVEAGIAPLTARPEIGRPLLDGSARPQVP